MNAKKISPRDATGQGQTEKRFEDRPNWASCFKPRNPKGEHPPDFIGVTAIEGHKYWLNVYLKRDRNGKEFASVQLKPFEP